MIVERKKNQKEREKNGRDRKREEKGSILLSLKFG